MYEDWKTKLLSDDILYAFFGIAASYQVYFNGVHINTLFTLLLGMVIIGCSIVLEKLNVMGEGDGWILASIFLLNGIAGFAGTIVFADISYFAYRFMRGSKQAEPFVPFMLVGFILWGVLFVLLGL